MKQISKLMLYTDGACNYLHEKNYGPGGWGFIIHSDMNEPPIAQFCGAKKDTDSIEMEMEAVIQGIGYVLKNYPFVRRISVYTDCKYIVDSNLKIHDHSRLLEGNYADQWEQLFYLMGDAHIIIQHVKGHNGYKPNEVADQLAKIGLYKLSTNLVAGPFQIEKAIDVHNTKRQSKESKELRRITRELHNYAIGSHSYQELADKLNIKVQTLLTIKNSIDSINGRNQQKKSKKSPASRHNNSKTITLS